MISIFVKVAIIATIVAIATTGIIVGIIVGVAPGSTSYTCKSLSAPSHLSIVQLPQYIVATWNPTEEATECDVEYLVLVSIGDETIHTETTADNYVYLPNGDYCDEIRFTVTVVSGEVEGASVTDSIVRGISSLPKITSTHIENENDFTIVWTHPGDSLGSCTFTYKVILNPDVGEEVSFGSISSDTDIYTVPQISFCARLSYSVVMVVDSTLEQSSPTEQEFIRDFKSPANLHYDIATKRATWESTNHDVCSTLYEITYHYDDDEGVEETTTDSFYEFEQGPEPCSMLYIQVVATSAIGGELRSPAVDIQHVGELPEALPQIVNSLEENSATGGYIARWEPPGPSVGLCTFSYRIILTPDVGQIDPIDVEDTDATEYTISQIPFCVHLSYSVVLVVDLTSEQSEAKLNDFSRDFTAPANLHYDVATKRAIWESTNHDVCSTLYEITYHYEDDEGVEETTTDSFYEFEQGPEPCSILYIQVVATSAVDGELRSPAVYIEPVGELTEALPQIVNSIEENSATGGYIVRWEPSEPSLGGLCTFSYRILLTPDIGQIDPIDVDDTDATEYTIAQIPFCVHLSYSVVLVVDLTSEQSEAKLNDFSRDFNAPANLHYDVATKRATWESTNHDVCSTLYEITYHYDDEEEVEETTTDSFYEFEQGPEPCSILYIQVVATSAVDGELRSPAVYIEPVGELTEALPQIVNSIEENSATGGYIVRWEPSEPSLGGLCTFSYRILLTPDIGQIDPIDVDDTDATEYTIAQIPFCVHLSYSVVLVVDLTSEQSEAKLNDFSRDFNAPANLHYDVATKRATWESTNHDVCSTLYEITYHYDDEEEVEETTTDSFYEFEQGPEPCSILYIQVVATSAIDGELRSPAVYIEPVGELTEALPQIVNSIEENSATGGYIVRWEPSEPSLGGLCTFSYRIILTPDVGQIDPIDVEDTDATEYTISQIPFCVHLSYSVVLVVDLTSEQSEAKLNDFSRDFNAPANLHYDVATKRATWESTNHDVCSTLYEITYHYDDEEEVEETTTDSFYEFEQGPEPCSILYIQVVATSAIGGELRPPAVDIEHVGELTEALPQIVNSIEENSATGGYIVRWEPSEPSLGGLCTFSYRIILTPDVGQIDPIDVEDTDATEYTISQIPFCVHLSYSVVLVVDLTSEQSEAKLNDFSRDFTAPANLHYDVATKRAIWESTNHDVCSTLYEITYHYEDDEGVEETTTDSFYEFEQGPEPCSILYIQVVATSAVDGELRSPAVYIEPVGELTEALPQIVNSIEENSATGGYIVRWEPSEPSLGGLCTFSYRIILTPDVGQIDPIDVEDTDATEYTISQIPFCVHLSYSVVLVVDLTSEQSEAKLNDFSRDFNAPANLHYDVATKRATWESTNHDVCSTLYEITYHYDDEEEVEETTTDSFYEFEQGPEPCSILYIQVVATSAIGGELRSPAVDIEHVGELTEALPQIVNSIEENSATGGYIVRWEPSEPSLGGLCTFSYRIILTPDVGQIDPIDVEDTDATEYTISQIPFCVHLSYSVVLVVDLTSEQSEAKLNDFSRDFTAPANLHYDVATKRAIWESTNHDVCSTLYEITYHYEDDEGVEETTTDSFYEFEQGPEPCSILYIQVVATSAVDGELRSPAVYIEPVGELTEALPQIVNSIEENSATGGYIVRWEPSEPSLGGLCTFSYRILLTPDIGQIDPIDVDDTDATEYTIAQIPFCVHLSYSVVLVVDLTSEQSEAKLNDFSRDFNAPANLHYDVATKRATWESTNHDVCSTLYEITYHYDDEEEVEETTTDSFYEFEQGPEPCSILYIQVVATSAIDGELRSLAVYIEPVGAIGPVTDVEAEIVTNSVLKVVWVLPPGNCETSEVQYELSCQINDENPVIIPREEVGPVPPFEFDMCVIDDDTATFTVTIKPSVTVDGELVPGDLKRCIFDIENQVITNPMCSDRDEFRRWKI